MTETSKLFGCADDFTSDDPAILKGFLAVQKNEYLQLAADFDNFRKRTRRDAEQIAASEKEAFIRDLLPIADNLERALASEDTASSQQLHAGVKMTLQQIGLLLKSQGIEAVEGAGLPFNPHWHEAIAVGHDSNHADHVVLKVIQRGYNRGDKVFRPARVIVNDLRNSQTLG